MSEKLEQIKVRSWMIREWHLEEKMLIHVANEGTGSARRGLDQKALGLKPGFPDLVLFVKRGGFGGLAIEMKDVDGRESDVKEKQREWILRLKEQGYQAKVCFGFEQAKEVIDGYLKLGMGK